MNLSLITENSSVKSEKLIKVDITKCRLCQHNVGLIDLRLKESLCQFIHLYLQINITEELNQDNFPKFVCENCDKTINTFIIFQQYCSRIDEQLKIIVKESIEKQTLITNEGTTADNYSENISLKIGRKCIKRRSKHVKKLPISNKKQKVKESKLEINNDIKLEEKLSQSLSPFSQFSDTEESNEIEINEYYNPKTATKRKNKEKPNVYRCDIDGCGKTYTKKSIFEQHRYDAHDIRQFLCTICGKNFGRYSGLKVHERIHLPTKQFVCIVCDVGFVQAANLRTHVRLHHEGHRYYCTVCGKGFLTNVTLKRHELTHVGIKDFKCDTCPSAFYTRRELIKHKRYHLGVRAYFCTVCYRTYVEKHHLTIHMRSHTGERPYACDVSGCAKAFTESQKLRRHKKNVHRINL